MSTGTALVNARTPTLKPEDQLGHGQVKYLSPEEQHAAAQAALGPDHELDCQPPPKNQQPGAKRRIVAKPVALAANYGDPVAQAIAVLVQNQLDEGAFIRHLDTTTKEALLSALADDLGLSIE